MKIIVTTSDKYHHILPIFFHLYNKYWGAPLELVGYEKPDHLPDNVTFYSMGKQRGKSFFSDDLYKYFEQQDEHFIWMMEDTFIRAEVDKDELEMSEPIAFMATVGRLHISEGWQQSHFVPLTNQFCENLFLQKKGAPYKLSTQPSIWKKSFLLKYMTPGLSPWDFESQESYNDGHHVMALRKLIAPVKHNEGVRRFDLHKYNLDGIDEEAINEMKQLNII